VSLSATYSSDVSLKSTFENMSINSAANHWVPEQPYNDLPELPPALELETRPVLKQCVLARAALAALKQAAALIPNQQMLINTIPLLEAKDSSEIENIVTTADRLFQFAQADNGGADAATKEALRYRTALYAGFQSLAQRPLCTATAVAGRQGKAVCPSAADAAACGRQQPRRQLVNPVCAGRSAA